MFRYLAVFLVAAALGLVTLLPYSSLDLEDLKELKALVGGRQATTVLLGNSVSRTFSRCDRDVRSIGDLTTAAGVPVIELARGGLKLDKLMKYGRLATQLRDVGTVVLPIQVYDGFLGLAEADAPLSIARRIGAERSHFNDAEPSEDEFYQGVRYGSLGEISAAYFASESAAMTCPEHAGTDLAFVRYMYWRNYLRLEDPLNGVDALAAYSGELESRSTHLLAVFMPQNLALIRTLHGVAAAEKLSRQVTTTMAALRHQGVDVLDLTEAVSQEGFADQWCACGHLGEDGRHKLAEALAHALAVEGTDDRALDSL